MNIKNTRAIIIGIMILFIISSFNPLFVQTTKAIGNDLTVNVSSPSVFETQSFQIYTSLGGDPVPATVTLHGPGGATNTKEGSSVSFTVEDVTEDTTCNIAASYQDEDGNIHQGSAAIEIKNRWLVISGNYDGKNDNNLISINVRDNLGNNMGLAQVSLSYEGGSDSSITGALGNTILKIDYIENNANNHQVSATLHATHSKTAPGNDGFTINNINWPPNKPNQPSGGVGPLKPGTVGETYSFSTSTDDPEGDTNICYNFDFGDGGSSSSTTGSTSHAWEETGTYFLKVTATDIVSGYESKTSGQQILTVPIGNEAPTATITSGPRQIDVTASASFTAEAYDEDKHEIIRLTLAWGDGSISDGSGTSFTASHNWGLDPNEEGNIFYVKAQAEDEYGLSGAWSAGSEIIVGNLRPSVPSRPSGSYMAKQGKEVSFSTSSNDPNGDALEYWFDFGDGTSSGWGSSSRSHSYSNPGTYTVKVKVQDHGEHGGPVLGTEYSKGHTILILPSLDLCLLSDAAMPMNIDVTPLPTVQPISNMVPKTFINENGEVERIDDSFSVNSYSDGTYGLQQNGQTVQQGFQSAEEVQNYAATYVPSDNEDNNNGGSNSNNDNSDDNSDDSNDEQDQSEEDNADNEEDEEDPVSYPTVYSISNYKEPSEWVDDADEKDEDSKDSEPTKEDDQDGEIQNENTIDVTVRFDGSGTLVPLYAQADQETPVSSASIEIQSEEASENSGKMIGISSFFQSLIKIFPALTKLNIIKQILQVETPNTDDVESKEITDEDEEQITPSETNIPPKEENIVEDIPDTSPVDTDESEEENENPSETNAFSDEENTENNDETNDITEDTVVSEDSEDEDLIVTEDIILDLLEEENIVFLWDFGDGTAATGITPTHTYHITIEGESSVETDKETSTGKLSINSFSTIPNPGNEMPVEAIDENAENFDTKYATYPVTLFIVIDEQGILKNIESIDKNILSQVEIISQDKTTVTIGEISSGPSLDGIVQQVQLSGIGDLYSGLSLLAF